MDDSPRRKQIIRCLDYPRALVRTGGLPRDCRYGGEHCADDPACAICAYGAECRWLCAVDQPSGLALKTTSELESTLAFAIEYVMNRTVELGHNSNVCRCDHCRWLRSTRGILKPTTS